MLVAFALPVAIGALLVALPWLDRGRSAALRDRKPIATSAALAIAGAQPVSVPLVFDETGAEPRWRLDMGRMARAVRKHQPDLIAGIESRGFLIAAPLALKLGCGFIMIRKPRKLPGATIGHDYALEYGTDRVEIQADAVQPGQRHAIAVSTSPSAHNCGRDSRLDEACDAAVRVIEVLRVHRLETPGRVRKSALILPAFFEISLVGVRSTDDLHHAESLGLAVCRKFLESLPGLPFRQTLPPGVSHPEERRPVSMCEVALVCRDLEWTVAVQFVFARVGIDFDLALDTV